LKLFRPRVLLWGTTTAVVLLLLFVLVANVLVERMSDRTYNDVNKIPENKVGLLLGTAKYAYSGNINLYYKYRLLAAATLFNSGKISYILVSGDNATKSYNEPATFREDLISMGIPADRIVLDYAGFRTLDSILRCKLVFGEREITVISQQFHNERAIFLANYFDIEAVGFNAKSVSDSYGFKTKLREVLARTKVLIDILLGVEPRYLGDKIKIG
jgi:SanA protein